MSMIEIKVAASPDIPRYKPLRWWQHVASFLRLPIKREMEVVFLKTQNCYIVSPDSLSEFTARLDTLGFRSAERPKLVK